MHLKPAWLAATFLIMSLAVTIGFSATDDGKGPDASSDKPAEGASLAMVQAYLNGISGMQADFQQLMFDAESNITQESSGNFRLQRPGKFRWDYEQPWQQTIVADGERLWIYDADLEQVTVRRMDDGFADTPATLLSGVTAVADSYSLANAYRADGIEWSELQPVTTDGDFQLVRLGFANGELQVMDLVDSLGQTTRIIFTNISRPPAFLPSVFTFLPPPGADVISEDDL